MKVTYNWLRDFVDIRIPPRALADRLTMVGLEVVSLEERAGDCVFEIEVTSNRPDCLSIVGIAREVSAATGIRMRPTAIPRSPKATTDRQGKLVLVEDRKDCPLYIARIISGVRVGPSPDWLKKRLELVGCRSVNNVVDITNYVLFEWGQPLHAFDLARLETPPIVVRRARQGERLVTIDGQERILKETFLVIADKSKPVAIAGIMGGKETEVALGTTEILLEAAVFDPVLIRRTRQALGMQSESAYRFERGIDILSVDAAALRAAALLEELCAGVSVSAKSSRQVKTKKKAVRLCPKTLCQALGLDLAPAKTSSILSRLGFKVRVAGKDGLTVFVPSHRQDIAVEVDLIEEVARIQGFDRLPTTLPAARPHAGKPALRDRIRLAKEILVGLGLQEVITYSLIDAEILDAASRREAIEVLNPLSEEQALLRPELMPSLVNTVAYNIRQQCPCVEIFEIAKTYRLKEGRIQESNALAIALSGKKTLWLGDAFVEESPSYLRLKGILGVLLQRLGIIGDPGDIMLQEAGPEVRVAIPHHGHIGIFKKLERASLERFGIKNREVYAAELDLDRLFFLPALRKAFTPFSRLPGVVRDISLDLQEGTSLEEVSRVISAEAAGLLQGAASLTDYPRGEVVPPGRVWMTVSCRYASEERTLTDAEVNAVHQKVISGLKDRLKARIR